MKSGVRNVLTGDIYHRNGEIMIVFSETVISNLETGEEISCDYKDFYFGKLWGNYYYYSALPKEKVFPVQLQKLI